MNHHYRGAEAPRLLLITFLAVVPLAAAGRQAQAPAPGLPSASEIISRHVAALGGEKAFKAIKSMHLRGTVEVKSQGLSGTFELFQARPDKMVQHVVIPASGSIDEGYDGKVGWMIDPQAGPSLLADRELADFVADAWFDSPLHSPDHIREMTVLERTQFNNRPAFKLRVVYIGGQERFEYFDAENGLQIGIEGQYATPMGVMPMRATYQDYQKFGTILQISSLVERMLGIDQNRHLDLVEYNDVPSSVFDLPKPIKALIK